MTLPARGPGANGGRHRPDPDAAAPGLSGLSNAQAAEMAEEANAWYGFLSVVAPGVARFRVAVKKVRARKADGDVVEENAVQLMVATANGVSVTHMPVELAEELRELLDVGIAEARTGIATRHTRIVTPGG